ncbi:MAG: hypothetical protein II333_02965 [Clostridia bacterium]|nr:hypothetical protein [Clostridia bacterium]
MANIHIDFSKTVGKMKPLHGVNSGPKTKVFTYNASPYFCEAEIPFSRLHDVEYPYGSGEFVDIHCVFPNFDADENDPASYNFGLTDLYIEAIREVKTDVIYRLGESIEHAPVKRHIFPPKDFAKWARIAEHIIRHYNEGWADGHRWNIRYWEIWNEPDLDESCWDYNPRCWGGTPESFFDFYETAAKHLKSCFPELKIGGPAVSGRRNWTENFFRTMRDRGVPLDFFSWHIYTADPAAIREAAEFFRDTANRYGYTETEMLLDEWNYMENWSNQPPSFDVLVSARGAVFCAASLITMQKSPVDIAAYFEADVVKEWCGLFKVDAMAIGTYTESTVFRRPPFHAFCTFNELYVLENEVFSESDNAECHVCAASNGPNSGAMITGYPLDNRNYSYGYTSAFSAHRITMTGLPAEGCSVSVYCSCVPPAFREERMEQRKYLEITTDQETCEVTLYSPNDVMTPVIWEIEITAKGARPSRERVFDAEEDEFLTDEELYDDIDDDFDWEDE